MRASRLLASFGGTGFLRPAPGTWGSAAALPFGWLLHGLGGPAALLAATGALFAAGLWAVAAEERQGSGKDPGWIVIDEVVGMWIALLPLSFGLAAAGAAAWTFPWPGWVGAFLAFRVFDIWKPGPVGWADRRPGAMGVMLDDVIAGLFAAIAVAAAAAVAHLGFGL